MGHYTAPGRSQPVTVARILDRHGLLVSSQTLWDQLFAMAKRLRATKEAQVASVAARRFVHSSKAVDLEHARSVLRSQRLRCGPEAGFLLPLTNERKLRAALDELFYRDHLQRPVKPTILVTCNDHARLRARRLIPPWS